MNNILLVAVLASMLSILVVLVAIYLYRNRQIHPKNRDTSYLKNNSKESERLLSEGTDDYEIMKEKLFYLMEKEKIYLDPNIRIGEVAQRLLTNKTYLSKVIKYKTNKNFCQLVHSFRVKEAMKKFSENQSMTISQLCKIVGFNSMTTFNSAFGRNTGYSPAEWCKHYLKNNQKEMRKADAK
ncbi:MAG: helix-turn-helix domain-containing protein [Bacteroidales bacterium]|nr:helix-turn-helix domain-containing protein [Bacteroidales bacterium]MDD4670206.1 helix-turn-helix domain-containing protein [Bacteroidales bacterium]